MAEDKRYESVALPRVRYMMPDIREVFDLIRAY